MPVVVLNGASSTGKTSLGRSLQRQLGAGWFLLGTDDLLHALAPSGEGADLLEVSGNGDVRPTGAFRRAQVAWYGGLLGIARHARGLVVDEVLLGGGSSQARVERAFAGLPVVWVGVVCDLAVGLRRERLRGDRVVGMHAQQRDRVHAGVRYDHVVDTTSATPGEGARAVLVALRAQGHLPPGPVPPQ